MQGNMFMSMRNSMPFGSVRVVTFVMGPDAEEDKNPVQESSIDKLEKINKLSEDCAVCQEAGGSGMKLSCGHEFH